MGQVGCRTGPCLGCGLSPGDGGHFRRAARYASVPGPVLPANWAGKTGAPTAASDPYLVPGGGTLRRTCTPRSSKDTQAGALCARQAPRCPGRAGEGGVTERAPPRGQAFCPEALSWSSREAKGRSSPGCLYGPHPDTYELANAQCKVGGVAASCALL